MTVCSWLLHQEISQKSELENLKSRNYLPVAIPLAYDGLSLIINRENKDSCISVKNIKRVLSGEAKKWSDIVPGSSRGEILDSRLSRLHLIASGRKRTKKSFSISSNSS